MNNQLKTIRLIYLTAKLKRVELLTMFESTTQAIKYVMGLGAIEATAYEVMQ